jgi:hypothetical protein
MARRLEVRLAAAWECRLMFLCCTAIKPVLHVSNSIDFVLIALALCDAYANVTRHLQRLFDALFRPFDLPPGAFRQPELGADVA